MSEMNCSPEEKVALVKRMEDILRSHDIEMTVDGCGCCGSPSVTFTYKGEELTLGYLDECRLDSRGKS